MATDYDAPRRSEADELAEDSLEELKARRNENQSGVVDVDDAGLVFVASCLELLQRVFGQLVGFAAARSVVVGRHCVLTPAVSLSSRFPGPSGTPVSPPCRWSTFQRPCLCPAA